MLLLFLPLPYELISLVTDHTIINKWIVHQDLNAKNLHKINFRIEPWPVSDHNFNGYGRLRSHKLLHWCDAEWWYLFSQPGSDGKLPRASIDQELEDAKRKKLDLELHISYLRCQMSDVRNESCIDEGDVNQSREQ
jgi:hypothetical protein